MWKKVKVFLDKSWKSISKKALQFVGGLVMEQKDEDGDGKYVWVASLGRVAFWIIFGHMMHTWVGGALVTDQELIVFSTLLGYQGLKLGKDTVVSSIDAFKGTSK